MVKNLTCRSLLRFHRPPIVLQPCHTFISTRFPPPLKHRYVSKIFRGRFACRRSGNSIVSVLVMLSACVGTHCIGGYHRNGIEVRFVSSHRENNCFYNNQLLYGHGWKLPWHSNYSDDNSPTIFYIETLISRVSTGNFFTEIIAFNGPKRNSLWSRILFLTAIDTELLEDYWQLMDRVLELW